MRKHNGMRPQDIAILLKIISLKGNPWQLISISSALKISISEISESLNRSKHANLIDFHKKHINRPNLLQFLEHGLRYVFPQQPGAMVRGIPTAHSHPYMKQYFNSELNYVWPHTNGEFMGLAIDPLYPNLIDAIKTDELFYKLLSLADVIRVGKAREIKHAVDELKNIFNNES